MAALPESFEGLQQFIVPNVRRSGRELGVGAHGRVEELEIDGVTYAGKKIHEALVDFGNAAGGRNVVAEKFVHECRLMSRLRHPHVVQFIGVCFIEGSRLPMLVMEYLPENLDHLLETVPGIPLGLKRSVLHDVALGLAYLHGHNPPIVHRDLTARNVLLNFDMRAKLGDFGVARIMGKSMTQAPGNFTYMPPEALGRNPDYDVKIDIFSLGHMALFVVTQVFPELLPPNYPDPEHPQRLIPRTEVDRRAHEMELLHRQLGERHPLVWLVESCLQNSPDLRPTIHEVLRQLEGARAQVADPYGHMTRLEMMRLLDQRETERSRLQREVEALQVDLNIKEAMVEQLGQENSELKQKFVTQAEEEDNLPPSNEDTKKSESTVKHRVEKYNKQIKTAVQTWLKQLRSQKHEKNASNSESHVKGSDSAHSETETDMKLSQKGVTVQHGQPTGEVLQWSPKLEVFSWGGRQLAVKLGNIVNEDTDVIVVPNNVMLLDDGGGVYGAVNRASDGAVQRHCAAYIQRFGPLGVGHAVVTKAGGGLKSKWVVHTVGPDDTYTEAACRALLSQAVCETLTAAESLQSTTLALPAISTGLFSVDAQLVAEVIVDAILCYSFGESSALKDIRIVILSDHVYACFAKYLVMKQMGDQSTI